MPLTDYGQVLERLQRGLANQYARAEGILNEPGKSVACKLDPNYYLAVEPLFTSSLAKWAGVFPKRALNSLVRTGNLLSRGEDREHVLRMRVVWPARPEGMEIRAAFVLADFIERGLAIHGGGDVEMTVSDLKIAEEEREKVDAFFEGKTPLGRWAFEGAVDTA
ncbi:hypothetical protein [Desulfohalovibrio reitneri]|uniref:hypothetical protein n=1 Tax=Desulfohalovibrio reitneri TaxID=1307759 RepID=UPI0004A6B902|nr:hypothetical protein [Desulfohalovibrio reitneri]